MINSPINVIKDHDDIDHDEDNIQEEYIESRLQAPPFNIIWYTGQ